MKNADKSKTQAERLVEARIAAGFDEAKAAAKAYGWKYDTYIQHERGDRGLKNAVAERYAKAFKVRTAWLSLGEGEREAPPDISALTDAFEGMLQEILHCDKEEASAFVKLAISIAQEPPTQSAGLDFHRVLGEREARKFLHSKRLKLDGA